MKAAYMTPAVTVLDRERKVDEPGQEALYEHLIRGGVDGILVLGSLGEFFALNMEQKKQLISLAARCIRGRAKWIVGTTSMVLSEILELSDYAREAGADAVMVIPPYYFCLNQESIEEYYDRIAEHLQGPLYLYNFPERTGYGIDPETILRLRRKHPNIVGVKDTLGGMDHTRQVIELLKPEFPDFEIYAGFDDNFAHNVLAGGDGCIGGLSNVAPGLCHRWTEAFRTGDMATAAEIQRTVDRLMEIYRVGTSFVPYMKKAIALAGPEIPAYASFPFPEVTGEQEDRLRRILRENGLL